MVRVRSVSAVLLGLLITTPAIAAQTSIAVAGSTALLPLVKSAATEYSHAHSSIDIAVSGGGSGTGLTEVAAGAVDIGDSDVPVRGRSTLADHRVAVVGFAIITHPAIGVRSLSAEQLAGIFSGTIANWREVGGPNIPIVVVNRPRSSGTRAVFRHTMMHGRAIADSGLTVGASGTVVTTVTSTPGTISYVALSALTHSSLAPLGIDGAHPTRQAIASGKYPLWGYEHMYTNGEARPEVQKFIDYVAHDEKLLSSLGYFSVRDIGIVRNDR